MYYYSWVKLFLYAGTVPALALCWYFRPPRLREVGQHERFWIVGVFALDGIRRIILLHNVKASVPSVGMQIFSISVLALVAVTLWARVFLVMSYKARKKDMLNRYPNRYPDGADREGEHPSPDELLLNAEARNICPGTVNTDSTATERRRMNLRLTDGDVDVPPTDRDGKNT